ncbi:MAG: RHS repeat protein [Clostridia bacterium]|nr:RHS repeat protein [Clostridia bacterium]
MSRTTKRICRFLSVFLSLALLVQFLYLQGLPTLADTAETPSSTTAPDDTDLNLDTTIELLGEDVSRREENVKHYFLSNHTSRAIVYAEPVHYEVDGEWQEIDNTLSSEPALDSEDFNGFVNLANSFQVKFANNTNSSKLVRLRKDNYEIAWGYDGNAVSGNVKAKSKKQVTTPDDALTVPVDNAFGQIDYPYVEDNTSLQYIVSGSGLKENIVIHSVADAYTYTFSMKVKNVTLSLLEDGSVVATATDTGETVFTIPAPFMVDANHRYSNAVSYSLTQDGNKKYTLTVTADAEWINSDETAFPVMIDPVLVARQEKEYVTSAWINDGTVDNENTYVSVGWDTYSDVHTRALVRIDTPTLGKGDMVVNAQLALYMWHSSWFPGAENQQINAHVITESWDEETVGWGETNYESAIIDYNRITAVDENNPSNNWKRFDITRAVKGWYADPSTNYGILIKQAVESDTNTSAYGAVCWFHSENYNTTDVIYPTIVLDYRNNKGLEDYWTFTGLSAGSAGTAYINDYSGNLVFIAPLLTAPGERMPLSLSAVYNGYSSDMRYAAGPKSQTSIAMGWRLNIQQTLLPSTSFALSEDDAENYPYVYTDGDGTDHYFAKLTENNEIIYRDEDGLGLKLTKTGTTYTITNEKDYIWKFNAAGNLTEMIDPNGNTTTIYYQSAGSATDKNNVNAVYEGRKIDYVRDGGGHVYEFNYVTDANGKTSNYVASILDDLGRGVSFFRSNESLSRISYTDGLNSFFTYDDFDAQKASMLTVEDYEGYQLHFEYTTLANGKQVKTVQEYSALDRDGYRTAGQKIVFDRTQYNQTVIHTAGPDNVFDNSDDLGTYCQFDNFGRLTSSQVRKYPQGGNTGASVVRYTATTNVKAINRVESSAVLGKNVTNWVSNGNAESGMTGWTPTYVTATATATASTAQAYFGKKSILLSNTAIAAAGGRSYVSQTVNGLVDGGRYTLSAYVKLNVTETKYTDNWTGAYIAVKPSTSSTVDSPRITATTSTAINDGWHRLSVTVTLPTGCTSATVYLIFRNIVGTACFDGIQLEGNASAHPFNLLENAGFERVSSGLPTGWTAHNVTHTTSGTTVTQGITTATKKDFSSSLMIKGSISTDKYVSQVIPVSGDVNESYIVSGWAKANALNDYTRADALFEISIRVNYKKTDGTTFTEEKPAAPFNNSLPTSVHWQYAAQSFTVRSKDFPSATPISIEIRLRYKNQVNNAYFDFLQLIREPAPTYTYDEKGNLVTTVANAEQQSSMSYDGSDLTSVSDAKGYNYTYTYDDNHNVLTATSAGGVKTLFTYDTSGSGNATSAVVQNANNTQAIASNVTYTSVAHSYVGTHVGETSDADGNVTTYTYDTGERLTSTTAPNGLTTSYTHVSGFDNRISSVSAGNASVSYYYYGDRLSSIDFGDNVFHFEVDEFGNPLSTRVNGAALFTNTYAPNNGPLQRITYANGDIRTYAYNWLGQLSAIGNGTANQYTWQYDDNGTQIGFTDLVAARKFLYTRDSLNRLVRQQILSTTDGSVIGTTEQDYDIRNNLTRLVSNYGGHTYTQRYIYDAISGQPETERYAKDNLPVRYLFASARYADYDYDGLNRLTQRTFTTDRQLLNNYTYYASERNTGSSTYYQTTKLHTEIVDNTAYRYTYDDAGNIIKIEKGTRVSGTNTASNFTDYFSYEYDLLGQLTRVNSVPEGTTTLYFYDNFGNMSERRTYAYTLEQTQWVDMELQPESKTRYYCYDSDSFNDVITGREIFEYAADGSYTRTTTAIHYDEMGNPIDYEDALLTWQNGRQLASYNKGNTSISYTYDVDGLRTGKTVNGAKSEYLYLNGLLSEEIRDGHRIHYSYDSYGHLAAIQYYFEDNQTFALYYVTTNAQGDVLGLYDGDGDLIASYEYDAWGNVISITDLTEFGIATINPIRYRGYYFDEETGWYYLQSRYYDPVLGRCITPDSTDVLLASPMSLTDKNLYAYCDNNPVMRADHGGAFWHILAGAAAGALISGVVTVASNLVTGNSWNDGLGTAMLAGAASGALASSGVAIGWIVIGNAAISMAENVANQVIENQGFNNFDVGDMLIDGAIGGASGALGGAGKGTKHLTNLGKQTVKRTFNATTKRGLKAGLKEAGKAFAYYGKNSAKYYKNFVKGLPSDLLSTVGTTIASSDYMKYQYRRIFGR